MNHRTALVVPLVAAIRLPLVRQTSHPNARPAVSGGNCEGACRDGGD